jgi:putative ABC transport system permease protein
MWQIAYQTLFADRGKLFAALGGVVFAFVLACVQGGLYLGLIGKASLLVDNCDADIWVGHHKMHNVDFAKTIPLHWIDRLRSIADVDSAEPYVVNFAIMSLPSGGFEEVVLIGVDRNSLTGNAWSMVEGSAENVRFTDGVIVDADEDRKLEYPQVGEVREIGGRRARVVGKSKGIVGFLAAPYVFTTFENALTYADLPRDQCSYYLIKVRDGADPNTVCAQIESRIPELQAYTRDEYARVSIDYWMTRTGIGISFGLATVLGLVIGLVMVAQSLYALVLDRIEEFATLKAIGAPETKVYRILFLQALLVAAIGVVIGGALVMVIQHYGTTPKAPIVIPSIMYVATTVMVVLICMVSALLPYLRVRKVDPLAVLQS